MLLRFLLTLAILVQQLALPVALAAGPVAGCETTACCTVVETTTCCGSVVREMRCGKTGGACLCGVGPGHREQTPPAPRPGERSDPGPMIAIALAPAFALPAPVRHRVAPTAPLARPRTHNETQALLCIWRT